MLNYYLRRIGTAVMIIFCVTVINYFLISLAPGNPVDMMVDPNTSSEVIAQKKEQLGLNQPVPIQYLKWLEAVAHGDFGYSYTNFKDVRSVVGERILPTLLLTGSALILGLLFAIPFGILSAQKQYSKFDNTVSTISLLLFSIPAFILALGFIYIFSIRLHIFPTSGMRSIGVKSGLGDAIIHLFLPVISLALGIAGTLARYVRSSVLEVLHQDYLRTARAKGLHETRVIWVHALKNALNPIVSMTGIQVAELLGGSVVVEQLFSWPGLGSLTYQAVSNRDYPVLMAINLITAMMVLGVNILTDVIYTLIDPRIKYE